MDEPPPHSKPPLSRLVWVVVGLSVAVAAMVWVIRWVADEEQTPARDTGAQVSPDFRAFEQEPPDEPPAVEPAPAEPSPADAGSPSDVSVRSVQQVDTTDKDSGGEESVPDDASMADAHPHRWNDPVNQRVLGQKKWMAKLPDAEQEAIEETLDQPRPKRYPFDMDVRQQSVDRARTLVYDCFDALRRRQPQATGRLTIAFDLQVVGGQAQVQNPAIPTNHKLGEPGFEACILDGLARISYPAQGDGTMQVEYPFLFEVETSRP